MSRAFDDLVAITARLRAPGGCPWDRAQDLDSIARYVLEEAREVAEAARAGHPEHLREEIGDLLYTACFLAEIGRERGWFDMEASLRAIVEKLVRRHPHVFAGEKAESEEEALRIWERVKAAEKDGS